MEPTQVAPPPYDVSEYRFADIRYVKMPRRITPETSRFWKGLIISALLSSPIWALLLWLVL